MTARLAHILRHPIKSVGREELEEVTLAPGAWLPFDRLWAITHEKSRVSGGWEKGINFLRCVSDPGLMAITARLDEASGRITLRHPAAGEFAGRPDDPREARALVDWLRGIRAPDKPAPTGVYRAADAHISDMPDPWVSVASLASLKALSQRAGVTLSMHRFRCNLWLDGLAPWQEQEWIGRRLRVGDAVLEVREEITRCKATMANPATGRRDVDTLGLLNELGHQEFGVYAEVVSGGRIARGADAELLP